MICFFFCIKSISDIIKKHIVLSDLLIVLVLKKIPSIDARRHLCMSRERRVAIGFENSFRYFLFHEYVRLVGFYLFYSVNFFLQMADISERNDLIRRALRGSS